VAASAPPQVGLLLFAHGARDQRWAEPFLAVRAAVQDAKPELPVELAFLELMQPDLAAGVKVLVQAGCKQIRVVPLFLGEGSHLRRDLPALIEAQKALYPELSLTVSRAAGEAPAVLLALADYCLAEASVGLSPPEKLKGPG
jgi:sirohydrochlorin cobaltochelatase